jgi:hypothetical protein
VAQQGPPPRRPSRLPRSGRHDLGNRDLGGRPDERRDDGQWDEPQDRPPAPRGRHSGLDRSDLDERPAWPADDLQAPFPQAPPSQAPPPGASRQAAGPAQAPPRPAPQAPVPQQAPPRPSRAGRPGRPDRETWRQHDPFAVADDEADAPPWAGPSIYATRAGGTRLQPPAPELDEASPEPGDEPPRRRRGLGRAAATRLRRSRRRVYIWCGTAIVLAVIVAGIAVIHGLPKHTPAPAYISTLQAGEFRAVPSACSAVSPALLSQYLPGTRRQVTPADTSRTSSQCSFTVDAKPVFRVLEVTLEAYQPSLVAAGNGSATDNATDVFLTSRQQLAHPGKKSPLPAAQLTTLTGLGTQAVSALQVVRSGHTVTDLVTVLARDHNVLLTVSLQAQASGGGYGPVTVSSVQAGALAVTRAVLAKAAAEPAVKA